MNTRFSKSILILAATGLLSAGSVFAGNGPGTGDCDGTGDGTCTGSGDGNSNRGAQQHRGSGAAERMAGMANRLGLTIEQQVQALELFDVHAQERAEMQARIFGAFGTEICDQRALHREDFLKLLTPEQLALHEQAMEQRGEKGNRKGRGGFGGGFDCEAPVDD